MTRLFVPLMLGAALVGGACTPPTTAPPTTAPPITAVPNANQQSLSAAADWLLTQFDASGSMPGPLDPTQADFGNEVLAVASLEAMDAGSSTAAARIGHVESNYEDYVDQGAGDRPGALARVILAAVAAGEDPHDFGDSDLVARLEATIRPDGRFGAEAPNFDGSFRQGLSLAALSVVTPRPASITPAVGTTIDQLPVVAWLRAQQCADGSWLLFRPSTATPCTENPTVGLYKDSNGTALAILGLRAVGATPVVDPTSWITNVRGVDGGWAVSPSGPSQMSDANSTGLVVAAIEALGQTPDAAVYAKLRSFQLGASAPAADRGAFFWKPSNQAPNRLATVDAMTALFDEPWPAALLAN